MNIAIVGSRGFEDEALIVRAITRWVERSKDEVTVVSGGARGADIIGERVAKAAGLPVIVHLPDWNRWGKSAGFRRNGLIVADAEVVLAFFAPGPKSAGTRHTVAAAKVAGKAVYEYHEGAWAVTPARSSQAKAAPQPVAAATKPAPKRAVERDADGVCTRCGGSAVLPQFAHVEGGRCFGCSPTTPVVVEQTDARGVVNPV